MYSPKIPERLVPILYRVAKTRRRPMTAVVAEALDAYLAGHVPVTPPAPAPGATVEAKRRSRGARKPRTRR